MRRATRVTSDLLSPCVLHYILNMCRLFVMCFRVVFVYIIYHYRGARGPCPAPVRWFIIFSERWKMRDNYGRVKKKSY